MKERKVRKKRNLDLSITYTSQRHRLEKRYEGDVGYHIKAFVSTPVLLKPGSIKEISTGIKLQLKGKIEGQVRPISGLALKFGITVFNSPGTINTGYEGEVKVILINHSNKDYIVNDGDKIAQLVFAETVELSPNLELESEDQIFKEKNEKGLGSVGK